MTQNIESFQKPVTAEQRQALVGQKFQTNAHFPFNDKDKIIYPGDSFTILSYFKGMFICAFESEYLIMGPDELHTLVTSHDTTSQLPAALVNAASSMNFFLLRKLFRPEVQLDTVVSGEMNDFFLELFNDKNLRRHRQIKEVFSTELREGEYFEDLSMSDVRGKFQSYFNAFLDSEDAVTMTNYYMSLIPQEASPRTDDVAYASTDVYQIKPADRTAQVKVSLNQEHGNDDFPDHTEVLFWLEVDGQDAGDVSSIFVKNTPSNN